MRKTILLAVIALFLVLVTLSSVLAVEYTDLVINGPNCREDGSFTFEAQNSRRGKLPLDQVTVTAHHIITNHSFTVPGRFSQSTIHGKESYTKKADFVSNHALFNETGRYTVTVNYPGCKYEPCQKKVNLHDCPGFEYDCSIAQENFKINKCTAEKDLYSVSFEGLHTGQHTKPNPQTDVRLYFHSSGRKLEGVTYLKGRQLKDNGRDSYLLRFPRMQHEDATFLALGIETCPREQVVSCKITELATTSSEAAQEVSGSEEESTSASDVPDTETTPSEASQAQSEQAKTSAPVSPLFMVLGLVVVVLIVLVLILVGVVLLRD